MCIVCIDWEKGHLTSKEAFGAITEMLSTTQDEKKINHLVDLSNKILNKDLPVIYEEDSEDLPLEDLEEEEYE